MDYVDLIRERQTSEAGLEGGMDTGRAGPKPTDPASSRAPRFLFGRAKMQHKHQKQLRQMYGMFH